MKILKLSSTRQSSCFEAAQAVTRASPLAGTGVDPEEIYSQLPILPGWTKLLGGTACGWAGTRTVTCHTWGFTGTFKNLFKKTGFALKNIWSAGFGPSKFKSAGFCHIKMHFGMQALAPFFGSLQALDFKTQRKQVKSERILSSSIITLKNLLIKM